jgi:Chagasin family peptidase inhibitor I42
MGEQRQFTNHHKFNKEKLMSRIHVFFAFVFCLLLLTSCSSSGVQLTVDDKGNQVEVKTGDKITISLAGNPSTGFTWVAQDLDTSILE